MGLSGVLVGLPAAALCLSAGLLPRHEWHKLLCPACTCRAQQRNALPTTRCRGAQWDVRPVCSAAAEGVLQPRRCAGGAACHPGGRRSLRPAWRCCCRRKEAGLNRCSYPPIESHRCCRSSCCFCCSVQLFNQCPCNPPLPQPGDAPLPWAACNSRGITYSYDSLATSVLPVHRKLLDAGGFVSSLRLVHVEAVNRPGWWMGGGQESLCLNRGAKRALLGSPPR